MDEMIENFRQTPAYAPVGVLVGAVLWLCIRHVLYKIKTTDIGELMSIILAMMFCGMYIYMWNQGENPHDGILKENTLEYELPLLFAGGYYLIHMMSVCNILVMSHHLLSILAIVLVVAHSSGANVANTFGFLLEAPPVFFLLGAILIGSESPGHPNCLLSLLKTVFFITRFGALAYLTYLIELQEDIPAPIRLLAALIAGFTIAFLPSLIRNLVCGEARPIKQNPRLTPAERRR